MNENPNENPLPTGNPAPAEFPSAAPDASTNPAPEAPVSEPVAQPEPQSFEAAAPAEPANFGTVSPEPQFAAPADSSISVGAPKKNNKLILIIIAAVLLLAGIGVALYFILKPKNDPTPSQQSKSDYSLFTNLATSLKDTIAINTDASGKSVLKFVGGPSAITGIKANIAYDVANVSFEAVLADDSHLYLKVSGLSMFSALIPGLSAIDGAWIVLSPSELQTLSESITSSISIMPTTNCGSLSLEDSITFLAEIAGIAEKNFPLSLTSTTSSELTGKVYRVNISSEKLIDLLAALADSKVIKDFSEKNSKCLEPVVTDCVSTVDSDDVATDCAYAKNSDLSTMDLTVFANLTDEERAEYAKSLDEVFAKLPPVLISVDDNDRLTGLYIAGSATDDYGKSQSYSVKLNLSYGSVAAPTSSAITLTELFSTISE